MLEGHTGEVSGALALSDGRLLVWSEDNTFRLWDGQSGARLSVLEGHTKGVVGALALANGRLLSWSYDKTLRLWDGQSEVCLEVIPEDQVSYRHPDWFDTLINVESSGRIAFLRHEAFPLPLAGWHGDSNVRAEGLFADGRIVFTQANGQVCILKLHHGNRRISLAEAEVLLTPQMKKVE